MKDIVISVIMSVYNAELYLSDAIESTLNQSYENFEFIIINDGSTDDSLKILKKYALKDSRIKIINRSNKGLVYSLNEAISMSKGKYIARMDADDICPPSRLDVQLDCMEKNDLDICGGHYKLINEKGDFIRLNKVPLVHDMCTLSLLFKVPFAHPSVLIRKNFLIKHALAYGQSNYKKAEDLDLWIRMHKHGAKFGNVDNIVLSYRVVQDSLFRKNKSLIIKESNNMFSQFYIDNLDRVGLIINNLPSYLNSEEQSLVARYVYHCFKRLDFSHLILLKKIRLKIILRSFLSEMIR